MKQCRTCGEVYETIKTCPCPKRGGARAGAGRKSRPAPKSKGIWLGQITDEQRDFIMQWLSPDERYHILLAAANKACSGFALCPAEIGILHNKIIGKRSGAAKSANR